MAGGEGGMKHFMAHIGPAIQGCMDDLGTPKLTPQSSRKSSTASPRKRPAAAWPTSSAGATGN
jgi:hypothetical protein